MTNSDLENNEQEQDTKIPEKKKVSLQEAIKQKLANKKQEKSTEKPTSHHEQTKKMKSQQTKKRNNQSRRTGV